MSNSGKLSSTHWLIIIIASIGFLFDTYELLMTPLVAAPAIAVVVVALLRAGTGACGGA